MKRYKLLLLALVVCWCMCAFGQTSGQQNSPEGGAPPQKPSPPQKSSPPMSEHNPRYELRPGDVLDFGFTFSPEFNQSTPIQPDGYITLRDVGDLHVAGMSLPQVRDTVAKAYSKILVSPEITVQLKEFEKPYFVATGQVVRPGKYEIRGATRLTEAIAMAGGFTDSAKHSQVVLFRRVSPEWMEAKLVDVKKLLGQKNLNEDAFVHAGDIVYVPQSRFSHFRRYIPAPGLGMSINTGH